MAHRVFHHEEIWTWRIVAILLLVFALAACSSQGTSTSSPSLPENSDHQPGMIVRVEEIIIAMLFIAALVGLISQRIGIPYTIGLVIVGFGLAFLPQIEPLDVSPELILALLVPPLVYEAAFLLNFHDLKRDLRVVLTLAVPGVILTTFLVGGLVSLGSGIGLPYALVFGALIAATDPVAVVALFRTLGAPKRLQALLEGESLLNDGTAIVLFNLMLGIALTGQVNIGQSAVEFFIVSGGGIAVGVAAGVLISQLIGRVDNALVETALTTVLAYGSYLIAEYVFGVSGILAVVAAGLSSGEIGPRGMSATTRIVVLNFWEFAAFMANSFWKHTLFWGGLRGAISLSLALSLTANFPYRTQLQSIDLLPKYSRWA